MIMTEPMRQMAHPSFPSVPSFSFKKYDPKTAPINTLSAPRGVTSIAGANAYAAKFATSPTITADLLAQFSLDRWRKSHMIGYLPTILGS